MDLVKMQDLVNRVANHFETERNAQVTSDARQALIDPAKPHLSFVASEIAGGRITEEFLECSARIVLENAYRYATTNRMGRRMIDGPAIADSMKRYCPYLFWG